MGVVSSRLEMGSSTRTVIIDEFGKLADTIYTEIFLQIIKNNRSPIEDIFLTDPKTKTLHLVAFNL